MNRMNFARCSGVIVDACKGHGTWFDRDELSEIIQFIRSGGFEVSRQKEKRELEFERQQLRTEQMVAASRESRSIGSSYCFPVRLSVTVSESLAMQYLAQVWPFSIVEVLGEQRGLYSTGRIAGWRAA